MISDQHIYRFSIFPQLVVQGISTRKIGSIKDSQGVHEKNLEKFAKELHIDADTIVFPKQVHGATVRIIERPELSFIHEADGLLTRQKRLLLGIVTADCVPILMYEPSSQIWGVMHAGYKGILAGVIETFLATTARLGVSPDKMIFGIGPSIGVCCYDVPFERVEEFQRKYPLFDAIFEKREEKYFLNLTAIVDQILQKEGINQENREIANICTKDQKELFYSFRGDTNESFGEFASIIGVL